jgi:O-antigen/teichoic acid export membrane protein
MTAWVGPSIGADAATVLRVLAVGLTANLVAQLALAYVQGAGRPELPAFGHLAALPLYGVGLWVMVPRWGVVGAAIVWSLRAIADAWWLVWGCGHARVSAALQVRRIQWLVSSATLSVAAVAASAQWISSWGAVVGGLLIWTVALALMVRDEAMLRSNR